MLECHWKSTFGVECFGCGFQRSFLLLIEGNVWESIRMFPATIPLILTVLFTVLHLRFRFSKGARIIVLLFSSSALLMLVNFIYRFAVGNWSM